MARNEAETRTQLIDPALHARGWTEDLIRREETLGTVEIVDGRPRRQTHGRTDYTLRIKVAPDAQPVAVAVLEAKSEDKHPTYGLDQAKDVPATAKRLNVPFVDRHERPPVGAPRQPQRARRLRCPARWPTSRRPDDLRAALRGRRRAST